MTDRTAPTVENYAGQLPNGWTGGEAKTKWWRGQFVHLYELRKPCAQCNHEMKIDVTRAALIGTAKNAGLHLRRCQECRASNPKTHSRPVAEGAPAVATPSAELETLRAANATMTQELDALYANVRELQKRLALEAVRQKMPWERQE